MAETTEQYRTRISQIKTSIENEPRIVKMRDDIAEGISKTGNRQADIEVRQDTLEDDFVAVQQDASYASPSGAEVAVARGGHSTLDERLTKKEREVTAQFAQNTEQTGINPLDFGAIGDGVTDDGLALEATHVYANSKNLKVCYPSNKTFYVSEIENIEIKTDTDFGNSKIIVNDVPLTVSSREPLFLVTGDTVFEYNNDSITSSISGKIKKINSQPLTELANGKIRFVEVYDDNVKLFSRRGYANSPAESKRDIFKIDGFGNILDDVTFGFDKVTRIYVSDIESKLTVKNGVFHSTGGVTGVSGVYDWRNIVVEKSNVCIDNITHTADDFKGKRNSVGFIYTRHCADVLISNSELQPLLSDGSYAIANEMSLNITFDNLKAESNSVDTWGAHVSYYSKNLTFRNSKINRIDSHQPIHNLAIFNSEIGEKGLTICGFGDLVIRDTKVSSVSVVTLREDYGSFWDGNIIIDNLNHYPTTEYPRLFNIFPNVDFDFGIGTRFGRDYIRVSNYTIHDTDVTDIPILMNINGQYNSEITPVRDWYKLGASISFEKIKRSSGKGVLPIYTNIYRYLRSDNESYYNESSNGTVTLIPNTIIELTDVRLDDPNIFLAATDSNVSNLIRPMGDKFKFDTAKNFSNVHITPKFIIERCNPVYASVRGLKAILNIKDSLISSFVNLEGGGSQSLVNVDNCVIEPKYLSTVTAKYMIRSERKRTTFTNCRFRLPVNEGGKITIDNADFATVYTIFANLTHATNIDVEAVLSDCKFEDDFDVSLINSSWLDFNADLGNVPGRLYRKIGTTAQRPYSPNKAQTFFDTSLGKLVVFNGTTWI